MWNCVRGESIADSDILLQSAASRAESAEGGMPTSLCARETKPIGRPHGRRIEVVTAGGSWRGRKKMRRPPLPAVGRERPSLIAQLRTVACQATAVAPSATSGARAHAVLAVFTYSASRTNVGKKRASLPGHGGG